MTASLPRTASGFDRFGFDSSILRGVLDAGFLEPRPIQAETIPAALAGRDVLGTAVSTAMPTSCQVSQLTAIVNLPFRAV